MNTLTLIKKQIEKAAALHDAQIAMTSPIVVSSMSVSKVLRKYTVLSAIVVTLTLSEATMQAIQVASLGSILSVAFLGLLYGELTLLQKR